MLSTHTNKDRSPVSKANANQNANANGVSMPAVPALQQKEPEQDEPLQMLPIIAPIQKKPNNTGLPDDLKSGIENLSGISMDDTRVHFNSQQPEQFKAHAYAQGNDIHVAAGQEKHLPHEAWHIVQQNQGRVKPTLQMKGKININDEEGLEKEAHVMGTKALQFKKENRGSNLQINRPKQDAWHIAHVSNGNTQPNQMFNSGTVQKKDLGNRRGNSSTVVQLKPADWAKAPMDKIVLHDHGWFDPWKTIKGKIAEYVALNDLNLDMRRATMVSIRPLIAQWEAHKNNTAASIDPRIMGIFKDMPVLKAELERELTEIALAADAKEGGHAYVRHGSDLTDGQLQDRIGTQKDRAGAAAPAKVSSRFATQAMLLKTRNNGVKELSTALVNTKLFFAGALKAYTNDWQALFAARDARDGLPRGRGRAARAMKRANNIVSAAKNARNVSKANVHAKAAAIPVKPIFNPDKLPVNVVDFAADKATPANVEGQVNKMVQTYNRYMVQIDHKMDVGNAFAKYKDPLAPAKWAKDGAGKFMSKAIPAPKGTTTILTSGIQNLMSLPPAATAAWLVVTHFPIDAPPALQISDA